MLPLPSPIMHVAKPVYKGKKCIGVMVEPRFPHQIAGEQYLAMKLAGLLSSGQPLSRKQIERMLNDTPDNPIWLVR